MKNRNFSLGRTIAAVAAVLGLSASAMAGTPIYTNTFDAADLATNDFTNTTLNGSAAWAVSVAAGTCPNTVTSGHAVCTSAAGVRTDAWLIGPTAATIPVTAGRVYTLTVRRRAVGANARAWEAYIGSAAFTLPAQFQAGGTQLTRVYSQSARRGLLEYAWRATTTENIKIAVHDSSFNAAADSLAFEDFVVTEFTVDTPLLSVADVRVTEGNNVDFVIQSDIPTTTNVAISWAAQNGFTSVATNGTNWTGATSGTTSIVAPATSVTVSFPSVNVAAWNNELNFFFSYAATSGGGATENAQSSKEGAFGFITNDDAPSATRPAAFVLNTFPAGTTGTFVSTTPLDMSTSAPIAGGGRPLAVLLNTDGNSQTLLGTNPGYIVPANHPFVSANHWDFAGSDDTRLYWAESPLATNFTPGVSLWSMNTTDMRATPVTAVISGLDPGTVGQKGIRWSPTAGAFYLVATTGTVDSLYTVTTAGAATKVADLAGGGYSPASHLLLGFGVRYSDNAIFFVESVSDQTWSLNPTTGAVASIGGLGSTIGNFTADCHFDQANNRLIFTGVNTAGTACNQYTIDPATGAALTTVNIQTSAGFGQAVSYAITPPGASVDTWSAH